MQTRRLSLEAVADQDRKMASSSEITPEIASFGIASETVSTNLCCVCNTSIFHYGYEPMNMGCQCHERICKWCVQVGKVRQCPTCRKYRRKPIPDNKWKKKVLKQDHIKTKKESCLACHAEISLSNLIEHEQQCLPYRDMLENVYLQTFESYRDRVNQYEEEMKQMNETVDLQGGEIEDLEESLDGCRLMMAVYEAEKRVYQYEQQAILQTLNRLGKPLQVLTQRVNDINTTVETLKRTIRESKENHKTFQQKRRRLGLEVDIVLDYLVQDPQEMDAVDAVDVIDITDATDATDATDITDAASATNATNAGITSNGFNAFGAFSVPNASTVSVGSGTNTVDTSRVSNTSGSSGRMHINSLGYLSSGNSTDDYASADDLEDDANGTDGNTINSTDYLNNITVNNMTTSNRNNTNSRISSISSINQEIQNEM